MRIRKKLKGVMGTTVAVVILSLGLAEVQAEIVGLYRFEDGGNVGLDSSGSGNDLTINGDAAQSATAQVW